MGLWRTMRRPGSKAARLLSRQYSSVVAWGRNLEGQCGVKEFHPVLLRPLEVANLSGATCVAAGRSHSAAVDTGGEAWTWGEGREGKLGHGCTDNLLLPSRVESLVGRTEVRSVALGRHHTLFLDAAGKVWSCGENKEGQCGLGTPLQELADQRRQEWDRGASVQWTANGPVEKAAVAAAAAGGPGAAADGTTAGASARDKGGVVAAPTPAQQQQQQQRQQPSFEQQQFERQVEYYSEHGWHSTNLLPFVDHRARAEEIQQAQQLYDDQFRAMVSGRSAWQRFVAARGGDIAIAGLAPGQVATPVPVGRDRQAMLSMAALFDPGLAAETVTSLAACRFLSAVTTAAGGVWTFGGGFNGELGGGASWSSAARQVEGLLAEVIRDQGGAAKVVAGGSFCAALLQSGRVVLWGQPRGGGEATEGEALELPQMRARKQGGVLVAEFVDLPPMTDLAAGYSHLLFTDGSRVWSVGRRDAPAAPPAAAPAAAPGAPQLAAATAAEPWLQPRELLRLDDETVSSLAAGGFASAAVTGNGQVYMWGTLLQKEAVEALLERSQKEGLGHWAYSSTAAPQPSIDQWAGWAGMHSPTPAVVPGLSGVQQVALGSFHALALLR